MIFYVMNHPKPEEWVPYLYGGLAAGTRRQFKAHLKACPECRGEIERWRRSAGRLKAWKLPRAQTPFPVFAPALKWAVAALVVLAVGFAAGRFTGTEAVAARVRAQMEPQVRSALQEQMTQLVRNEVDHRSSVLLQAAGDQTEKLLAAYDTVNENRRTQDLQRLYVALKRQLDTVAINTEQEFGQLASYHPPAKPSR